MPTCPSCGKESPPEFQFCPYCGSSFAGEQQAVHEVRKTVTVVFCDVTGSTSLGEQLDPESLRSVMDAYFGSMKAVIERHGGSVEKFIGDAVMAVFGVPTVHEDDALRAVRAAAEMGEALDHLNEQLQRDRGVTIRNRTGVNTGEVVAGDQVSGQRLVTGDAVNVAARLEQAAQPGQILIGDQTYRLVRDAVTVERVEPMALKGKADPVPAFRLLEVLAGAAPFARRMDSPMVGRERELALLRQAFDRALSDRACQMFTVLGPAGVGKTRLLEEFLPEAGERAVVLRGRCLPYGEGITYRPVVEVVKEASGITDADSAEEASGKLHSLLGEGRDAALTEERLSQLMGLVDTEALPDEIFWAVRRFLETVAARNPAVILFDDIHWGQPTFLDLVEHVADWSRDAPMLLLGTARPELLDDRPAWGGGKLNAATVLLEPLSEAESELLIANLLGAASLADEARSRISEAAEGNPLFVEQLLAMLIDQGLLRRDDGHWVPSSEFSLSRLAVPPTIHALLAARLDRLQSEERHVIERASIEGKVFHVGGVVELSPEPARPHVRERVMALLRKELIRPGQAELPGEDAFRFRHLLIRDAAYEAMPKRTRADLHERFAGWLERVTGDRVTEYEEIVGYHLEQAYRLRAELGPVDEGAVSIGRQAAERLASAGARTMARGDVPASINLYSRAAGLIPADDPARLELLPLLGEALVDGGRLEEARAVLDEAVERAAGAGDVRLEAHARVIRLDLLFLQAAENVSAEVARELDRIVPVFEQLGDQVGLARAWRSRIFGPWINCRYEAARQAAERALEYARAAGHRKLMAEMVDVVGGATGWGPIPVEEALPKMRDLMAWAVEEGGLRFEAAALSAVSRLTAMTGDVDEGLKLAARRRSLFQEMGMKVEEAGVSTFVARIKMMTGDAAGAERELRVGYEKFEEMGERGFLSTVAADLAEAIFAQGRPDEALPYTTISEQLASGDDVASQSRWRAVRAKVLAVSGRAEEAEALAREGVAFAERTDSPQLTGDAYRAMAEVLAEVGRKDEATHYAEAAVREYEAKGDVLMTKRAMELVSRIVSA